MQRVREFSRKKHLFLNKCQKYVWTKQKAIQKCFGEEKNEKKFMQKSKKFRI